MKGQEGKKCCLVPDYERTDGKGWCLVPDYEDRMGRDPVSYLTLGRQEEKRE